MVNALTPVQYDIIYNCTSLGLASMMASTVFFFLRLQSFSERYKAALCFTGLVTFIAAYHYFRIFNSFNAAYTPCETINGTVNYAKCNPDLYGYTATGKPFNDAYRYMDWFLTVPLLLIEIVLVMKLSPEETVKKATMLGVFSGLMIIFGYPGEMIMPGSPNINMRWLFWGVSMIPFLFVVYTLTIGTKEALDKEEDPDIKSKINSARIMTIVSWLTYPVVYILPMFGLKGAEAIVGVQMGYTVSDIISKCGVGLLIYKVTLAKSEAEGYSNQVDEKH